MSIKENNFLSFEFSIFLDDHTSKLHANRRFSENLDNVNLKNLKEKTHNKIQKSKRSFSIETDDESKSNNFTIANFCPKFQRFTSNEELFSFTSNNSFENEEEKNEEFLEILKEKFYQNIATKLKILFQ